MSPRLFLQQNRARFIFLNLLRFSPIFALSMGIGVLDHSRSLIATQGFLGAYTGIFTAERRRFYQLSVGTYCYSKWRLPPLNSPDGCLYFRRDFSFYHHDFIGRDNFTDPPKLEGGVCHKPLCCRRCRRTCDEAEVVYHPDSFTCLIFDRRKSGYLGNADILLFCW